MSRRSQTAPAPRSADISPVIIDTAALASLALKFPGGHVCDIVPANRPLVETVAQDSGIEVRIVEARAALRGPQTRKRIVRPMLSVYVEDLAQAPLLLKSFHNALVERIVSRAAQDESEHSRANGNGKQ